MSQTIKAVGLLPKGSATHGSVMLPKAPIHSSKHSRLPVVAFGDTRFVRSFRWGGEVVLPVDVISFVMKQLVGAENAAP